MTKKLKIYWDHDTSIDMLLNNNEVSQLIHKKFKNLQHVDLQFHKTLRDNPFGEFFTDVDFIKERLVNYASKLGISIDIAQASNQQYLNYLHEVYEKNYHKDANPNWLQYHEAIHQLESYYSNTLVNRPIIFDYREKSGLLETRFDREFLKYKTTQINKGDCYITWQELAKKPYDYYINNEPNDIKRMCELAKPWLILKPNLYVATQDQDFTKDKDIDGFLIWFQKYRDEWCSFWKINDWDPYEMFSVIPIGFVADIDELCNRFKNNNFPVRITV